MKLELTDISEQRSGRGRRGWRHRFGRRKQCGACCPRLAGTLAVANREEEHVIKAIKTDDAAMKNFLFTLGCYEGEPITVISVISNQYVVVVKDARYSIDENLASCIVV